LSARILEVLQAVRRGEIAPEAAIELLVNGDQTDLGFAVIDDHRPVRTGIPDARHHPALATRMDPDKAAQVKALLPDVSYEPVPRLLWRAAPGTTPFETTSKRPLWVVSAGTSDQPVAEEAARCAEWFGLQVHRAFDVGVAGLHRVLARAEDLRTAHAIIVVAGMEGALPSVVAGLVRIPVIAVPTSVGYGTHLGGLVPLLAMLNSCASGVTVVNVDNGFGAALVAWRILEGVR